MWCTPRSTLRAGRRATSVFLGSNYLCDALDFATVWSQDTILRQATSPQVKARRSPCKLSLARRSRHHSHRRTLVSPTTSRYWWSTPDVARTSPGAAAARQKGSATSVCACQKPKAVAGQPPLAELCQSPTAVHVAHPVTLGAGASERPNRLRSRINFETRGAENQSLASRRVSRSPRFQGDDVAHSR